jgi:hypothetical protein
MENNESRPKEKLIFDVVLFFYQVREMLKTHNSLLSEKITEGDITSASIAFNNALIIANIKRIMNEHQTLEQYSKSKEFEEHLKTLLEGSKKKNQSLN